MSQDAKGASNDVRREVAGTRPITDEERDLLAKTELIVSCHADHPNRRFYCDRPRGHDGPHQSYTILGKVGAEWAS